MKKSLPWHDTRVGAIALWLGSVQLAVPILVLVAIALAAGTWLESTRDVRVARALVYGSWWFIALMGLVCVSLIFAVVSRYPWKRRHVGFITVHAGLVAMIVGGFWSMMGRVEGHLGLEEGQAGAAIETQEEQVELVRHEAGQFTTVAAASALQRAGTLELNGIRFQIIERWENSREEEAVADDGPEPFRAVCISTAAGMPATWVGQEDKTGGAATVGRLRVRVLPEGAMWEPTSAAAPGPAGFAFAVGDRRVPLADEGKEAFPGWTITSLRRFARATVGGAGLVESPAGEDNPAVEVTINDGKGSTERHTAFQKFPDMVMNRPLEGEARSGARLMSSTGVEPETFLVFGTGGSPRLGYIAPDGTPRLIEPPSRWPATFDLGSRQVRIEQEFARTAVRRRPVRAPAARENRAALVIRTADATEPAVAQWKGMVPISAPGGNYMLRFGPRMVRIPFSVRLVDFRKTDYPGTEMAMAYESDVAITRDGGAETPFHVYMNHPYVHGPWRVYQSGFVGDNVSIFSVMRDPAIPLTYTGAALLCLGIVVTFYSRSLSWGHPGIPVAFSEKEPPNAVPSATFPAPARPAPGGLVGARV